MTRADGGTLVTGGAGFIGCALSRLLAPEAERWVAFDNLHPQVHPTRERPADLDPAAELVVGDVTKPDDWEALLDGFRPNVVVHLAAETGTAQSLHEATRHAAVNVVGTTALLDALGRVGHRPRHFVLSSSRAVYGEGEWRGDDGEIRRPGQRTHAQLESAQWDFAGSAPLPSESTRTWPAPTSVYGATKLAQEHVLRAWAGAHDVSLSVLRFQNVYGPGQSLTNSYTGIVSLFSQLARRGEAIPVYEDGLITRDFVFIDDVAASLAAVMGRDLSIADVSTHDIGSGIATTILELAGAIAAYYDAPAPRVTGQFRDGDVRHASCDISRSTTELSWSPTVDLTTGVGRLQEWISTQPTT